MIYWVVGIAGVVGALLRHYIGLWVPASIMWGFPMGTLLVNYIGCFILSWFTIWSTTMKSCPSWIRVGIGTGLIGSFTTFSTFSVEVIKMFEEGLWLMSLVYIMLSLWGGLFLTWSGYTWAIYQQKRTVEE
jgi:CrcB protein